MVDWKEIRVYGMELEYVKKFMEGLLSLGYVRNIKVKSDNVSADKYVSLEARADVLDYVRRMLHIMNGWQSYAKIEIDR